MQGVGKDTRSGNKMVEMGLIGKKVEMAQFFVIWIFFTNFELVWTAEPTKVSVT